MESHEHNVEEEEERTRVYPGSVRLSEGFVWANTYIAPLVMHIGSNVTLTREDGRIRSMTLSRAELLQLAEVVMERTKAGAF